MAKKETKKKNKKNLKGAASTLPPTTMSRPGMSRPGGPATAAAGADAGVIPPTSSINSAEMPSQLTAEQLTQAQLEEAIKESQDPSSKLKKLKSPFSVKGFFFNLLILVILTIAIILLICYIKLDKDTFNLLVVIKDILDKFHITDFFLKIGHWFQKVFGGKSVLMMWL